ncbi:hypothetical protein CRG98_040313 [Punica granatum]|uniref:Uncharacterized protein n=1 Tax=Punica granatum TaxID=22663 RepID=A0A2I0I5K7_PUNGR|nr:hypothetical protein CRG98_040313 [Punica granatum]
MQGRNGQGPDLTEGPTRLRAPHWPTTPQGTGEGALIRPGPPPSALDPSGEVAELRPPCLGARGSAWSP